MRRLLLAITVAGLGLHAQETEPRMISVQLARAVKVVPDVAMVRASVTVTKPISLSEAAAIVKPAGFTEADLTDGGWIGPDNPFYWRFGTQYTVRIPKV